MTICLRDDVRDLQMPLQCIDRRLHPNLIVAHRERNGESAFDRFATFVGFSRARTLAFRRAVINVRSAMIYVQTRESWRDLKFVMLIDGPVNGQLIDRGCIKVDRSPRNATDCPHNQDDPDTADAVSGGVTPINPYTRTHIRDK